MMLLHMYSHAERRLGKSYVCRYASHRPWLV